MNNSKFVIDNVSLEVEAPIDNTPVFRQRSVEIAEVIEAIEHVMRSNYWQTLQARVFNPTIETFKKRLAVEKDPIEMYRLQGRIEWAEKLNLTKFLEEKLNELANIKQQIHGK